jgi:hypothetical protein
VCTRYAMLHWQLLNPMDMCKYQILEWLIDYCLIYINYRNERGMGQPEQQRLTVTGNV